MAYLSVEALSKAYRRNEVIRDLSFEVERGEFLVVFGPSGAGKTVLLRLIAGMVLPDRGRVVLGGADITRDAPDRRDIGMAFQNFALYPHMTAYENIASPLRSRGMARAELDGRVHGAANLLRIDPRHHALAEGTVERTEATHGAGACPRRRAFDAAAGRSAAQRRCQGALRDAA